MSDNFSGIGIKIGIDTNQANKDLGNMGGNFEKVLGGMKLNAQAFSNRWGDLTKGVKDTKRIISGILISQSFLCNISRCSRSCNISVTVF